MDSDNSQYIGWYNPRTKHQLITNDQLYLHISHFWLFEIHIPSGNLTVCYGQSSCSMNKSTINDHFQ